MNIDTIKSLDFFSCFNDEKLAKIAALAYSQPVIEGEILAVKGSFSKTLYLILSGNFMISSKEDRAITLHKKGDLMECSAFLSPFTCRGNIVSLTKGEVIAISGKKFLALIESDSKLLEKILQKIKRIINDRKALYR